MSNDDIDMKRLRELLEEIQEILPAFDAVMITDESLILTTRENLEHLAEVTGIELEYEDEVNSFEEMMDLIEMDDDDNNGNGGILQ